MKNTTVKSWKTLAKDKQLLFKRDVLKLNESGSWSGGQYPHILSDEDAAKGKVFYCFENPEEWKSLQEWADKSKGKKINFLGSGMKNLLRSEHIPYNFFYPLAKLQAENPKLLTQFLEQLFDNKIHVDKVREIKIEYASGIPKKDLLDDNTSFDVYIEYMDGNDKCGLGVEVKYTEKSYPYGDTEKKRMFDESTVYNELSRKSGVYKSEKIKELRNKKLKQIWRNHLLGLKLIEVKQIQKFHSVHLYPKGNSYQKEACHEYQECLNDNAKGTFLPLTFESFISMAEEVIYDPQYSDWINYLKKRY